MKIPRMTVITLGVSDLACSTAFYREIFSTPPISENEGVTFFPLPGVWLSLYPLVKLAEDIGEEVQLSAAGAFRGFTLAYNARSKDEISGIFARAAEAGAPPPGPPDHHARDRAGTLHGETAPATPYPCTVRHH